MSKPQSILEINTNHKMNNGENEEYQDTLVNFN